MSSASWLSMSHDIDIISQSKTDKSTLVYYQFRFGFIYFITSIYLIRRTIDFCCQGYCFQDKVSQIYGTLGGLVALVYQ